MKGASIVWVYIFTVVQLELGDLDRLIAFDFVLFLDLVAREVFRLPLYLRFVVVNFDFFLIFFFSHTDNKTIRLKAIVENLTA
jgi:hypothetical protein